jgi:hypothetical protein
MATLSGESPTASANHPTFGSSDRAALANANATACLSAQSTPSKDDRHPSARSMIATAASSVGPSCRRKSKAALAETRTASACEPDGHLGVVEEVRERLQEELRPRAQPKEPRQRREHLCGRTTPDMGASRAT